MNWAKFFAAVLPDLSALALSLWRAHHGDVGAAKADLKQMTDYGALRREQQAALDRELAASRHKP